MWKSKFKKNNELFIKLWLMAFVLSGALLTLSACVQPDYNKSSISPNQTSIYDPMADAAPGDSRPTAPSTDAIAPALENDNGNSGILTPTSAAGVVAGRR